MVLNDFICLLFAGTEVIIMKIKLDRTQEKLLDVLLFMAKLLALSIPLYLISMFPEFLFPLQEAVSQNIYVLLKYLGFEASREGFIINADKIVFLISEDCTGWKSMLFVSALILSVPRVPAKKRLWGILIGLPIVYIGNLARILAVVLIWSAYGPAAANVFHDYLWQAGMISLVLAIWISWLVYVGRIETTLLKRFRKIINPKVKDGRNNRTRTRSRHRKKALSVLARSS